MFKIYLLRIWLRLFATLHYIFFRMTFNIKYFPLFSTENPWQMNASILKSHSFYYCNTVMQLTRCLVNLPLICSFFETCRRITSTPLVAPGAKLGWWNILRAFCIESPSPGVPTPDCACAYKWGHIHSIYYLKVRLHVRLPCPSKSPSKFNTESGT